MMPMVFLTDPLAEGRTTLRKTLRNIIEPPLTFLSTLYGKAQCLASTTNYVVYFDAAICFRYFDISNVSKKIGGIISKVMRFFQIY